MAIGLGKILGFNFPENFNYPYIARSMTEFWRRWHMTLGSWFREYVYIPLGGNKVKKYRVYINLFIVWFLTGFWHGASYNFILWGLLFFALISIEKAGLKKLLDRYKVFSHIYVIMFLLFGWTLFAIPDMKKLGTYLATMFIYRGGNQWLYYLRNYLGTFIIALLFSTPLVEIVYKKYIKNKYINTVIILSIFILSVAYLVDATYNPFLYFRF